MHRTRSLLVSVLVAALVGIAGCSGDDNSGAASSGAAGTRATPTTAPACTPATDYPPGTTTHHLTVAGVDREFLVHLPPAPHGDMPLVVDFHGAGSNMQEQAVYSGFDPLADSEGFVVATPNGIDAATRQWRYLGTRDDVDFAEAIVDELVAHACVNPKRAFAAGISSGSAMSASLACQASDRFAGFGLVAADFYIPPLCDAAIPRPIIIFHGTDDAVVPYAGGRVLGGVSVQPAEESARRWAAHNGCAAGPREVHVDSEVVRLDWTGCREPVVMYSIVGGGHTWPGSAIDVARLGKTTHQIDATAEMWKMFDAT
jgi:polyhydroxybutyrate depolymerase